MIVALTSAGRVRFGGVSVSKFTIAKTWMNSSASRPRIKGYRHSLEVRKLCPIKEARRARKDAVDLARELGTSFDNAPKIGVGAAAASSMQCGPERWLVDTGSAFDLVGRHDVPDWCARLATPTESVVELSTTNGRMIVEKEVLMQVGPFQQHVSPLLLEHSPPVLSMGKRCMEEGYSCHWPSGRQPYLIAPDGAKHVLEVDNMVPYLPDPPIGDYAAPALALPAGVQKPDGEGNEDGGHAPVELAPDLPQEGVAVGANPGAEDEAGIEPGSDIRDLKKGAASLTHLMTHFPKTRIARRVNGQR